MDANVRAMMDSVSIPAELLLKAQAENNANTTLEIEEENHVPGYIMVECEQCGQWRYVPEDTDVNTWICNRGYFGKPADWMPGKELIEYEAGNGCHDLKKLARPKLHAIASAKASADAQSQPPLRFKPFEDVLAPYPILIDDEIVYALAKVHKFKNSAKKWEVTWILQQDEVVKGLVSEDDMVKFPQEVANSCDDRNKFIRQQGFLPVAPVAGQKFQAWRKHTVVSPMSRELIKSAMKKFRTNQ